MDKLTIIYYAVDR